MNIHAESRLFKRLKIILDIASSMMQRKVEYVYRKRKGEFWLDVSYTAFPSESVSESVSHSSSFLDLHHPSTILEVGD